MKTMTFTVRVTAAKDTHVKVECYPTAVNEHALRLKNGGQLTNRQIAEWIQTELQRTLRATEEEAPYKEGAL